MWSLVAAVSVLIAGQAPRLPVPDSTEVDSAKTKIRDVLAAEYKEAKTPEGKVRLAERLVGRAGDVKEGTANRYAFFVEARELYVDVGDLLAAFRTIDTMSLAFDQLPFAQKIDLIQRVSKTAKNGFQHRNLVVVSLKLAGDAATAEDYAVAKECCQTAVSSARATAEPALQTRAIDQLRQYEVLFAEWQAATEAQKTLQSSPNDAEAQSKLGKYRCFVRRDWEHGINALSHATDSDLAALANRDIVNPTDRSQQLALGESWLKYAEKQKPGHERAATAERAAYWLEKAVAALDGLDKVAAEKTLTAAYELACGRNFKKLLARAANGTEADQVADCRNVVHPLKLKSAFDLRKSWLLSFDFQSPNLDGGSHQIFFWGDGRGGADPLFVRIDGDNLLGACTDCTNNRAQGVATRVSPTVVGKWVNVKFVHDTLAGEIELYVDHRRVGHETMTLTPNADRKMPLYLGGTDATGQRFVGQVRNVWLGNIP